LLVARLGFSREIAAKFGELGVMVVDRPTGGQLNCVAYYNRSTYEVLQRPDEGQTLARVPIPGAARHQVPARNSITG
jgi:hypothetical protein